MTRPYTPRHNGKMERYQRTLAEELLYAQEFASGDARTSAIAAWNIHYNSHRPHSEAGGHPPASWLRAGVTQRSALPQLVRPRRVARCWGKSH